MPGKSKGWSHKSKGEAGKGHHCAPSENSSVLAFVFFYFFSAVVKLHIILRHVIYTFLAVLEPLKHFLFMTLCTWWGHYWHSRPALSFERQDKQKHDVKRDVLDNISEIKTENFWKKVENVVFVVNWSNNIVGGLSVYNWGLPLLPLQYFYTNLAWTANPVLLFISFQQSTDN